MAGELDALQDLEKVIDGAIEAFAKKVPEHEKRIYEEILVLLKDVKVKNGRILNTVENLKLIIRLRTKIKKIIASKEYIKDVKVFTDAFDTVTDIQNQYFAQFGAKFSSKQVADIVRQQSIDMTTAYLTEGGVDQVLLPKIEEILRTSITTGGSYAQMTDALKEFIVKTDNEGALMRYARQITTDALNQYSRNYNNMITQDMGWEWYIYRNSLIETSRDFCIECVKKRYIHKSEIPELLKGKINGKQIPIYDKTGLPMGMYPETNTANFIVYAGGYNCGHQIEGIPDSVVPVDLLAKFKKSDEYPKYNWVTNKSENARTLATIAENYGYKTEIKAFGANSPYVAMASQGKIYINKTAKFLSDPIKNMKYQYKINWFSTDKPEGIVLHEIAHIKFKQTDNFFTNTHREIAKRVSEYAKRNPKEFISETYAGLMTGKKYDDEVMRLYKLYTE